MNAYLKNIQFDVLFKKYICDNKYNTESFDQKLIGFHHMELFFLFHDRDKVHRQLDSFFHSTQSASIFSAIAEGNANIIRALIFF